MGNREDALSGVVPQVNSECEPGQREIQWEVDRPMAFAPENRLVKWEYGSSRLKVSGTILGCHHFVLFPVPSNFSAISFRNLFMKISG
jgi:hypothetical protein